MGSVAGGDRSSRATLASVHLTPLSDPTRTGGPARSRLASSEDARSRDPLARRVGPGREQKGLGPRRLRGRRQSGGKRASAVRRGTRRMSARLFPNRATSCALRTSLCKPLEVDLWWHDGIHAAQRNWVNRQASSLWLPAACHLRTPRTTRAAASRWGGPRCRVGPAPGPRPGPRRADAGRETTGAPRPARVRRALRTHRVGDP